MLRDGFMPFSKALMPSETHIALPRIWNQITHYITKNDNSYTKHDSIINFKIEIVRLKLHGWNYKVGILELNCWNYNIAIVGLKL